MFKKNALQDIKKIVQAAFQKAKVEAHEKSFSVTLIFGDILHAKDAINTLYTDYLIANEDGDEKPFEKNGDKYKIELNQDDLLSLIGDPMIAEELQYALRDKHRPRVVVPARTGTDIHFVYDEEIIAKYADKELYQKGIHARMDTDSPKKIRIDDYTDFYIIRLNEKEVTQLTDNPTAFKEFMRTDLWSSNKKKAGPSKAPDTGSTQASFG